MSKIILTNIPEFEIRFAEETDCVLIEEFIRALAVYEKMENQVVATTDSLRESLFVKKQAEVVIGYFGSQPVAFALFFHNYSTFLGKANLYLEDLFVKKEHRGHGIGKEMIRCLASIAVERGCARLDWSCLDWNVSSIEFYKKIGAVPMEEWTVYRLEKEALRKLANVV